ncbi:MAG TPA: PspC domain-containing protein [Ornithinimicrobium sp.]|uniref:PspC domain-containing protein n=1 Tax=Ornithinimicrobium sp. TaxID=1977084 RepID=UPI002B47EA5A|nr:PspC domain-containing protein [Ornithinimicrobium sp.]HKJ11150.1 PspC domain-containing protein [Ornithinimicrobium sp.]
MTEHTSSDTQAASAAPEPGAGANPDDGFFDRLRRMDLRRSPDGWLGGVCAGFAHRVGLDPLVVRAGAVLLVIFFGLGLLLYLVAWALIPDSQEQTHVEQGLRHGAGSSVFLLVITSLVLLGSLPWWAGSAFGFDGGFGLVGLVVTALLAYGAWTLWQRRAAPGEATAAGGTAAASHAAAPTSSATVPPPPPPGATTGPPAPGPAAAAPAGTSYGSSSPPPPPPGTGGTGAGSSPLPPPTPPRPRRPRRRSGGAPAAVLALGLLLVILAAALWAAQGPGLPGNDLSVALAVSAGVLGLLVLGLGVAGRRAGFVGFLTGVSVFAALLAAPLPANLQWEGRSGEATWAPTSTAELRDYRLAAGEAELDLTRIPAGDLDDVRNVEVSLGAGSLTILVPDDLAVEVDSSIGAGELRLRDASEGSDTSVPRFSDGRTNDTTSGLGVQEVVNLGEDSRPELVVDASVGVGEIVIEQEPTS